MPTYSYLTLMCHIWILVTNRPKKSIAPIERIIMDTLIPKIDAALAHAQSVRRVVGGFPYLAEALRAVGVSKNFYDVPSATSVYVTASGSVLKPGGLIRTEATLIPIFDEVGIVAAIRADQRGESTFPEFLDAIFEAGVVRYVVDTAHRTCKYFAVSGESYTEEYPAVTLPGNPIFDSGRSEANV
jgi:uncharacterized protein YbcV (DUF1398 family)